MQKTEADFASLCSAYFRFFILFLGVAGQPCEGVNGRLARSMGNSSDSITSTAS